jgi:hypothetical protein
VYWDETAQGPMVDRLSEFLEGHLKEMLLEVMDADQVAGYQMDEIRAALPEVFAEIDKYRDRLLSAP